MSDFSLGNIENQFIKKLLENPQDFATITDNSITTEFFSGSTKRMFKFILDFKKNYAEMPSIDVFSKHFPNSNEVLGVELTDAPIKWYCDRIRDKNIHNTLADGIEKAIEHLGEQEISEASKALWENLLKANRNFIIKDTVKISDDPMKLYDEYLAEMGKDNVVTGIPTGIDAFDFISGGVHSTDLQMILGYTGTGKANPLSTPILTPNGFIPMRDIKVGSKVIGEDGKPYNVTAIHPQGVIDVYEVTFQDGTKSRCSKEHLWKYRSKTSKHNRWVVDTLGNIMTKHKMKVGKAWNLSIPINEPVEFSAKEELLIDPYVLGVLIGDGGFTTDRITLSNPETDIVEKCQSKLQEWGKFTLHKTQKYQYCFKGNDLRCNTLRRIIKKLGLLEHRSEEKFIPQQYLYSSIENRKELLLGLMDTDGHVTVKGTYKFHTSSSKLKDDFKYLCRSLGYRCTEATDSRPEKGNDNYSITILTDDVIASSKKHLSRIMGVNNGNRKFGYDSLRIVDIQFVGQEECQCISVDSQDHTYICDDFIVTHNSWMECILADNFSTAGFHPLLVTREMSPDALRKRIDAVHNRFPYSLFKKRQLTPQMLEQYKLYLEDLRDNPRQLTIEKSTGGVDEIAAMLDLHKPDVVLVDGAYLLADDGDENRWMSIVNVWRGMKTLALSYKIPFVATMQLKANKANLDNIPYAKYIAQDCDVIWGMEQSEEDRANKALWIKSLKQRDSENIGKFLLNWDFTEMRWDLLDHQIPGFNEWIVKRNSQKVHVEKETADTKKKIKFKRGK